jgi:hypothetical protein
MEYGVSNRAALTVREHRLLALHRQGRLLTFPEAQAALFDIGWHT